jgi:protein SCO1/2
MPSRRVLIGFAVLGATALAAVAGFHLAFADPPDLRAGTALGTPLEIRQFALLDERGQPAMRSVLEGRWSVLFLGFTHCPDVCPTTLALLMRVRSSLRASGEDIRIVFLSADPDRDTPQALAQYLGAFGTDMLGLTGPPEEVRALAENMGLGYVRNPDAGGGYSVDHSVALVLIDPQARVAGYFRPPYDAQRLVADLGALPGSER